MSRWIRVRAACLILLLAVAPRTVHGQIAGGPLAPVAPEVVTRDESGRATLRAVRSAQPLKIDGVLDEAFYADTPSISDFRQLEPRYGEPATERTEVWLAFDDDNVYVAFRCWDTDMARLVATEMRRDSTVMWQGNDIVSFIFDPFFDRRNSIAFTINPLGGRSDGQVVNDRQYSSDWNPVWNLKTGRFDGGWTLEVAIPFKSLRYSAGDTQVWGFNALRVKRSKNELSTLSPVPPAQGQQAVQRASSAATLVGLEPPRGGRSLDLKPYLTSNVTTDRLGRPLDSTSRGADVGVDAKYAVTQNLTADLTVNTDFAQVEADEQQVNLTRFSLFFPEKREFFLENQGTFSFGGVAIGNINASAGDAPMLFYSRRIGLSGGRVLPLDVGGRLTGRIGGFTLGAISIKTGALDDPDGAIGPAVSVRSTNHTVVRLKRDLLRKSSVGVILTNRTVGQSGEGANRAYGVDATLGFFENLNVNTYWARTDTEGVRGENTSYRAQVDYPGDRYGAQVERISIDARFNPELGFVRRYDMVRDFAMFRFSPRPRASRTIRKFHYQGSIEYVENTSGRLESREQSGEFAIEFQNGDRVGGAYSRLFEFLPAVFPIGGGVLLPVGGYSFDSYRFGYNMSQQRKVSLNLQADLGTFYSGRKTTLQIARGRVPITNQLAIEPTYSYNRVNLAEGDFTTHLAGSRVTYTMTPLMFVSALVQYNSGINAVSTNARLRWEYRPGSELFVVYNEERNTLTRSFPGLNNRALIVKVNRLFRF
jgi:hypothetical protein